MEPFPFFFMPITPKSLDTLLSFMPQGQRTLLAADVTAGKGVGLFEVRQGMYPLNSTELYGCCVQLVNTILAVEDLPAIGRLDMKQVWLSRIVGADAKEKKIDNISPQLFCGQMQVKSVRDHGKQIYTLDTVYDFAGGKKEGELSFKIQLQKYGMQEYTHQYRA
jgi:hypothetical protein